MREIKRRRWLLLFTAAVLGLWWYHCATSGPRIVFVAERGGLPAIFSMNANGHWRRQLTRSNGSGSCQLSPVVSPDGKKIAYLEVTNDGGAVRVMNADGKHQHRVAKECNYTQYTEFSAACQKIFADGHSLLSFNGTDSHEEVMLYISPCFACTRNSDRLYTTENRFELRNTTLNLIRYDFRRRSSMIIQRFNENKTWHRIDVIACGPDDKNIFFNINDDIYCIDSNGNHLTQLTRSPKIYDSLLVSFPHAYRQNYAISPDNRYLVFLAAIKNQPQVFLLDIRSRVANQLTHESREISGFTLSPDGRKIMYTIRDDKSLAEDICTINSDGRDRKVLTHDIESNDETSRTIKKLQFFGPLAQPIVSRMMLIHSYASPVWLPEAK